MTDLCMTLFTRQEGRSASLLCTTVPYLHPRQTGDDRSLYGPLYTPRRQECIPSLYDSREWRPVTGAIQPILCVLSLLIVSLDFHDCSGKEHLHQLHNLTAVPQLTHGSLDTLEIGG